MTISDETWVRLRSQVDAAYGETFEDRESRSRREWREAVAACGWDGRTCCADPDLLRSASLTHLFRVEAFWIGLVRGEYALSGDQSLAAERSLRRLFYMGCSPWSKAVTRALAETLGRPVMTRRVLNLLVQLGRRIERENRAQVEAAARAA
jgi:hypothetical protein